MLKAIALKKQSIYFIISFILFSCSPEKKQDFPTREEILWKYPQKTNYSLNNRKLLFNTGPNLKIAKDSNIFFLYIESEDNILKTYLKKISHQGKEEWAVAFFDSSSNFNVGYALIEDKNRDIVIVGQQGESAWVVKADAMGKLLWQKTFEATSVQLFTCIMLTNENNYLIAGVSYNDSLGNSMPHSDIWLIKMDTEGHVLWERKYGKGDWDEFAYDIMWLPDSMHFVVGGYKATTLYNKKEKNRLDALVIKFTKNGIPVNYITFGGNGWDIIYDLSLDNEGHILCAGHTESNSNDFYSNGLADALIVKLDSSLNIIWHKNYGGTYADFARKIIADSSGYTILGSTQSGDFDVSNKLPSPPDPWRLYDAWLFKLNKDGEILWDACYGGSSNDYGYALVKTKDKKIIMVLSTFSLDGDIEDCIRGYWLFKLDLNKIRTLYKK